MSIHMRDKDLDNALPIGGSPDPWRIQTFNQAAIAGQEASPAQPSEHSHDARAEELQRQLSGHVIRAPNHYAAAYNPNGGEYAEDDNENSEKNKRRHMQAMARAFDGKNFTFTVENVVDYLSDSVKFDKAWLNMQDEYIEVSPDRMLHVKDGMLIAPKDDPQGKYLIKTLEEKQAYENSIRGCSMYKAQDEVMSVEDENGNTKIVDRRLFEERQSIVSEIERKEDVIARVRRGELAPGNIDQDLQDEVKNRAEGISPQAPEMSAQGVLASLDSTPQAAEPALRPVIAPQTPSPVPGF